MTKDEALKLALEALESSDELINGSEEAINCGYSVSFDFEGNNKLLNKAINAIKEALAQPEEYNFCLRCGKRNKDIHTCTSPQD